MSTKDIGRSALEGGRCDHNKSERRFSHRTERAATRSFLAEVSSNLEVADRAVAPKIFPVQPCFHDKLSAATRFMESRIGKSWAKTKQLLHERFDDRTTAGRHILHDHLLQQVAPSPQSVGERLFRKNFYVDNQGCLQSNKHKRSHMTWLSTEQLEMLQSKFVGYPVVVAWLNGRKVGQLGNQLYWFVNTQVTQCITIAIVKGIGPISDLRYRAESVDSLRFRQDKQLNPKEVAFFQALPTAVRKQLLQLAPVYENAA